MKNLKIFCMCLEDNYFNIVKKLNYIPVGLKNKNFRKGWLLDNTKKNISKKNSFYGEYTFYYWYWKNLLKYKKKDEWIGFCSYRELWGNKKDKKKNSKSFLLKKLPKEWLGYEAVIGKPIHLKKPSFMKVLKYGKISLVRNFREIFNKKMSIKFQFDMFHENGALDKAITLLPIKYRKEFENYVRTETSFNQGNMFISNSKKIMNKYFNEVFNWLKKCENVFGFNLKGYGKIRMYTFLAERFLPYWFKKNTKYIEWPVVYYDINKINEKN